jgi:Flp pilus assembly pilin Flp
MRRFLQSEEGATAIEYAILAGLLLFVAFVAASATTQVFAPTDALGEATK